MPKGFEAPRGPWWKNLKLPPAMGIAVAVLVAGLFGAKYMRSVDSSRTAATQGVAEGTLRVNINTATLTELESIPGIGTMLAKEIVVHRPYATVDELVRIRGIGESSLKGLRVYVKVEGETEKLR